MRKQGKLLGGEGGVWRTGELPNLGDLVREKGHAEAFNLLKQKSENAQANRKRESEERVKNMVIPGGKKKRRKKSKSRSRSKSKSKSRSKSPTITQGEESESIVKKSEFSSLNLKSDKTKKNCDDYRMKSPPPGCDGVDGCKWVPGRGNGCKDISELKTEDKIKIKSKDKSKKCKKDSDGIPYKKTKDPKCEEQEGCKWVKQQGKTKGHCSDI